MVDIDTLGTVDVNVGVTLAAPRLQGAVARRLYELGLRPGTEVVVLHRTAGGGRVVLVDGARVALDRATLLALPVTQQRPVALRTADGTPT
ncbi:MAG TPA: FeoA family protein [Mycobacteriales bacterium]|nr:FeoA family protein [Mycobacteriales bacterium]